MELKAIASPHAMLSYSVHIADCCMTYGFNTAYLQFISQKPWSEILIDKIVSR